MSAGVERIDAPTPYVWIIGRTKTDGPHDYDAVHVIQAGFNVTPLSRWGKAPEPVSVKIDLAVDITTPPKIQVDAVAAEVFFAYGAGVRWRLASGRQELVTCPADRRFGDVGPAARGRSASGALGGRGKGW